MSNSDIRKDFFAAAAIGVLAGLFVQPVLVNVFEEVTSGARLAAFVGLVMFAPLTLLLGFALGAKWPITHQFAKFVAVGTLNFFIDLGVLNAAIFLSGVSAGLLFSVYKALSFTLAMVNSFFWNKYWTFRAFERTTLREAVVFYSIAVAGGILNVTLASFIVNGIGRPLAIGAEVWANIGALGGVLASFLWNFLGYRNFVFRKAR